LLRDAPAGFTFKILHSVHIVFMSKQTATFALYSKKLFFNNDWNRRNWTAK